MVQKSINKNMSCRKEETNNRVYNQNELIYLRDGKRNRLQRIIMVSVFLGSAVRSLGQQHWNFRQIPYKQILREPYSIMTSEIPLSLQESRDLKRRCISMGL